MFNNSIFPSSLRNFVFFDEADTGGAGTLDDPKKDVKEENSGATGVSQDKVNELVGSARVEGRAAGEKALLESLGVESKETLQSLVKSAKEAEDANRSELEKARAEQERLQQEKDAASENIGALKRRLLDTRIEIVASKPVVDKDGKVTRPAFRDDALDIVLMTIDRALIAEGDDGTYSGIEEALVKLAEKRALLLKEADEKTTEHLKGSPSSRKSYFQRPENKQPEKKSRASLA